MTLLEMKAAGAGGSPVDAQYVTLALDARLTDERVLTAGTGITLTDTGAGGTITVDVAADAIYLRLDAANDPVTAGLEVNAATVGEPVLILQTTDDDPANNILEIQDSAGVVATYIDANGDLTIEPLANSVATLDVNQADSTSVLTVDTTNAITYVKSSAVGVAANLVVQHTETGPGLQDAFIDLRAENTTSLRFLNAAGAIQGLISSSVSFGGLFFQIGSVLYMQVYDGASGSRGVGMGRSAFNSGALLPNATLHLVTQSASEKGLIVRAFASQSANLQEWQDPTAAIMLSVQADGDLVFGEAVDIVTGTSTGTMIGQAANQKIGFFGTAPRVQIDKASFNNWAAFGDVVDALVALGLFDAA